MTNEFLNDFLTIEKNKVEMLESINRILINRRDADFDFQAGNYTHIEFDTMLESIIEILSGNDLFFNGEEYIDFWHTVEGILEEFNDSYNKRIDELKAERIKELKKELADLEQ